MVEYDGGAEIVVSGRCYCGATTIRATALPLDIAYCHCLDCRRVTAAPVAAFAAFDETTVTFSPHDGTKIRANPGVERTFCGTCGSSLAGRYDYLPGQVYIGLGLLDQANDLAPKLHAHYSQRLTWLHVDDDLERFDGSARAKLNESSG